MSGTSPNTHKGYLIGYPSQQDGMGYPCCIQGTSCTLVIGYHRGYPKQGILIGILTGTSKSRGYPYQYPQKDVLYKNRDIPTLSGISPPKWGYPVGWPSRCECFVALAPDWRPERFSIVVHAKTVRSFKNCHSILLIYIIHLVTHNFLEDSWAHWRNKQGKLNRKAWIALGCLGQEIKITNPLKPHEFSSVQPFLQQFSLKLQLLIVCDHA